MGINNKSDNSNSYKCGFNKTIQGWYYFKETIK